MSTAGTQRTSGRQRTHQAIDNCRANKPHECEAHEHACSCDTSKKNGPELKARGRRQPRPATRLAQHTRPRSCVSGRHHGGNARPRTGGISTATASARVSAIASPALEKGRESRTRHGHPQASSVTVCQALAPHLRASRHATASAQRRTHTRVALPRVTQQTCHRALATNAAHRAQTRLLLAAGVAPAAVTSQ